MEKEGFINRWVKYVFIAIFVTSLAVPQLYAQEFRATVSGEVTDPTGAPIPVATVNAVQLDTQRKYTAKSNRDGIYVLQYLPPGHYRVSVAAPGFKTQVYSDVPLESAQKMNLNAKLSLGAVHQQVTVTASQGLLNTATASSRGVVDMAKVQGLPSIFGNPFAEFMFVQGIQDESVLDNVRANYMVSSYSANGAPAGDNAFYIDGAPVSNQGNARLTPNRDSVQQLQVSVSPFDAQYGWMTGGSFNATLKSGTNHFHGDLYEYNEFTQLEANRTANNAAGIPIPGQTVNRFGGSLGGPVQKGKTFFFGSYQGDRTSKPIPAVDSVPTAAMRNGDFSGTGYTIYDPTTVHCVKYNSSGQCKTYGRDPFPNDVIPSADINPIGQAIANLYPAPNQPGIFSNYVNNGPQTNGWDQYTVRADHNFSQATRIYGLFIHESDFSNRAGNAFPGLGSNKIQNPLSKNEATFDLTRTFSPSLVGDFKVSFLRYVNTNTTGVAVAQNFTGDKIGGLQMPVVPTTTHLNIVPTVSLSSFTNIFGNTYNSSIQNNWYFSPSLSQVAGKHVLHYGLQYMALQYGGSGIPGQPNGEFTFNGRWSRENPLRSHAGSGLSVADLLLGYPNSGSVQWHQFNYVSFHQYGLYFQDDWKVRSNLTLNLGLRWDHYSPPTERYNRINGPFCLTCTNPYTNQIDYATYPNLQNPLVGGFSTAGAKGQPRSPSSIAMNNWQPRVGFAWQFAPKMVFRAGYGIYRNYGENNTSSYGYSQNTSYAASLDGNIDPTNYFSSGVPYPNGVLAPAGASAGLETNAGNGITYFPSTWHVAWTQHWIAGIERTFPWKMLVDVQYAGSHTQGLNVSSNEDIVTTAEQQACFQDNALCNARVPNPFYGVLPAATGLGSSSTVAAWQLTTPWPLFNGVSLTAPTGYKNYNALQVSVKRRMRSLNFVFNYTYANWMNASSYLNNGSFRDQNLYYGPNGSEWRHTFNFTALWPVPIGRGSPFFRSAHGILGGVINGWRVDAMYYYHTGPPLAVPAAGLSGAPGCTSYRPVGGQTEAHWFNNDPNCYVNLQPWQARTTPLYLSYLRDPATSQMEAALQKRFALPWEGKFLQARIEATNAFNHWNMGSPNLNNNKPPKCIVTCRGFGTIHPSGRPRVVVISMKLSF